MKLKYNPAVLWAVLAAALYALSSPVSKLLLESVSPTMMAAFLYLGAGIGMTAVGLVRKCIEKSPSEHHLTRKDLPYTIAMVVLDIAAPIFLMTGLVRTAAANVCLCPTKAGSSFDQRVLRYSTLYWSYFIPYHF